MPVNVSPEQKTTPKQDAFIQAMLAGNSIVASAAIAGCNEKTAHAWLKLESVQTAYKEAQRALFDQALSMLMCDVSDARSVLTAIMKDPEAPHGTRVRCAQIVLELAIELHQTSQLEERVAELVALFNERKTS